MNCCAGFGNACPSDTIGSGDCQEGFGKIASPDTNRFAVSHAATFESGLNGLKLLKLIGRVVGKLSANQIRQRSHSVVARKLTCERNVFRNLGVILAEAVQVIENQICGSGGLHGDGQFRQRFQLRFRKFCTTKFCQHSIFAQLVSQRDSCNVDQMRIFCDCFIQKLEQRGHIIDVRVSSQGICCYAANNWILVLQAGLDTDKVGVFPWPSFGKDSHRMSSYEGRLVRGQSVQVIVIQSTKPFDDPQAMGSAFGL